jgi:DNA-binding PadR family transcriptional regulator
MAADLRPISYAILALVGRGGASAPEIARMFRQGSPLYMSAAESHAYAEPQRLAKLGYLSSEKQAGKTRPRTVYALTKRGERALTDWLREPSAEPRIQNEATVRVMAGDMVSDADLLTSLDGMLPKLDELERSVDEMEAQAQDVPHRARYLKLNHRLARELIEVHRRWIDEVRKELGKKS